MNRKCVIAPVALLALASAASAQMWDETINGGGDAPIRPAAQMTMGSGPLLTITGMGNTDAAGLIDVDFYCVHIDGQWSATTVGGASWDTMLALYDASGTSLLAFNDDSVGLQSTIGGVVAPGNYLLGITRFPDFEHNDAGGQGTSPYAIFTSGMTYCEVPAPGAAALLGLGGLLAGRRRR
jgi:uncharacterized protein (TIGR03382 family)